jgi:hypothetical protein
VNIDPVSLFNYRLSCAINSELNADEESDFQSLYDAFHHHLHHHKKKIDVNAARIAAGRYSVIQRVLMDVDVDLGVIEPWSRPAAPAVVAAKQVIRPHVYVDNTAFDDRKAGVSDENIVPRAQPRPVVGYDRYGQAIYADDGPGQEMADFQREAFEGSPSQTSFSGAERQENGPEQELLKGFKRLLHKHHDK